MNEIKNLREITGAGFLDCKKALEENDNNIDESIDFLRKKGLAKASKKSNREAKEGAVGIYSNDQLTTIIQINTETDFAAKNEIFLNFMDKIGKYSLEVKNNNTAVDEFNKIIFDGNSIGDQFKDIISKIGENIILSKLIFIENADNCMISSYIHNAYKSNIGKIAVVLKSKVNKINEEARLLGKNLCMHLAASKPLALNIDQLDSDLIKKEKEVQIETIRGEGKPANIIEKILEGKMKKFYSEYTLMNQQFVLDPEKTIEKILSDFSINNKFEILKYKIIILGS